MLASIADLTYIRQAALTTKSPALVGDHELRPRRSRPFVTFSNDVAAGTGNATLQSDVSVLNALLRMEDDASLQRAYLYQALASPPPALTPTRLQALNQAATQQQADTSQFTRRRLGHRAADPQQHRRRPAGGRGEERGVARGRHRRTRASRCTIGTHADLCGTRRRRRSAGYHAGRADPDMRQVSNGLVGTVTAQANSLAASSLRSAIIISVARCCC